MDTQIILIHYLNFNSDTRPDHIRQSLYRYQEHILPPCNEKGILSIVLPVFESSTRVECINPQLVSEQEYGEALKIVNEAKARMEEFLKSQEQHTS